MSELMKIFFEALAQNFFAKSELIEPVLLQAAKLGIFRNTQLDMHLLEGPD